MSARYISLDTETTGLDFKTGDRVIEIGAVEILGRTKTNESFQSYLNPQGKLISEGAKSLTNIADEELKDKPLFKDVVNEFIDFIEGAELIIHNAEFDIGFLNNELRLINHEVKDLREICKVFDTLLHARKTFPGQKNSLDALTSRLNISGYDRKFHGALLDAQILSDVYLNLTGGQVKLNLSSEEHEQNKSNKLSQKIDFKVIEAKIDSKDLKAHEDFLKQLSKKIGDKVQW
ncbi:MAG: DNA polymerase III subunit epsilon [SAR86 cluster bacterium]|uniref:DNA polymerase III subunit epsilon n=1 Tax=SAR86 cluster bacterium TaxID=2030880 RepID=A0A520N038_9GAMM|nr:MAG: DNA polymerase III subunit epsilon [SAR86 cluster bacterium]|tara:strand:+ start:1088 stop:1786 length:699 start_codon:yes stop_codon:yes gene_type:complete